MVAFDTATGEGGAAFAALLPLAAARVGLGTETVLSIDTGTGAKAAAVDLLLPFSGVGAGVVSMSLLPSVSLADDSSPPSLSLPSTTSLEKLGRSTSSSSAGFKTSLQKSNTVL